MRVDDVEVELREGVDGFEACRADKEREMDVWKAGEEGDEGWGF